LLRIFQIPLVFANPNSNNQLNIGSFPSKRQRASIKRWNYRMKQGDKYNWAFTVAGVLLFYLFVCTWSYARLGVPKIAFGFLPFGCAFQGGATFLIATTLFGLFSKTWHAVTGVVMGLGIYVAVQTIEMVAFLMVVYSGLSEAAGLLFMQITRTSSWLIPLALLSIGIQS
jgi:hypothetical protein